MVVKLIISDISNGEPVEVLEPTCYFDRALIPMSDEFAFIALIDPYGDTVFNHLQMERFLTEWDQLPTQQLGERDRQSFAQIRAMAERCRGDRRLLLLFDGD